MKYLYFLLCFLFSYGCTSVVNEDSQIKGTPADSDWKCIPKDNLEETESFTTGEDGKIYDAAGNEFLHRGVNMPVAYYLDESVNAIPAVADAGFNSVRLVWCADNLERAGRCTEKDMHSLQYLDSYLSALAGNKLVAVLNLQNATGSDDVNYLNLMVEYLTRDDVKCVLNNHRENLQINIANEWYGTWVDEVDEKGGYGGNTWFDGYIDALDKLRGAGLKHQFIIDTCGWGQDPRCMLEFGDQLLAHDAELLIEGDSDDAKLLVSGDSLPKVHSNIVFSAHVYDTLGDPDPEEAHVYDTLGDPDPEEKGDGGKIYLDSMYEKLKETKLPFIVGEFASTHYGNKVDWLKVIEEKDNYGLIAWSWFGNSYDLEQLDIIKKMPSTDMAKVQSFSDDGGEPPAPEYSEFGGNLINCLFSDCPIE